MVAKRCREKLGGSGQNDFVGSDVPVALQNRIVGVDSGEGTPVPIPNTEVKLTCAENTWRAAARENRKAPTQRKHTEKSVCFSLCMSNSQDLTIIRAKRVIIIVLRT